MLYRFVIALAFLLAATSGAASPRPRELVVIVNSGNHVRPSTEVLEGAFLRRERAWSDNTAIIPINAPVDRDERRTFDRVVLAMSPDEAARYWLDQRIRGGTSAPREVADIVLTVKLIARMRGAIGYVPADTELQGVTIVARIRGDKLRAAVKDPMRAIVIPILLVTSLAACETDDERCDQDQRYMYGLCYEITAPSDATTGATYDHFGDPCESDDACAAPSNFCAIEEDETVGYCTRTGCLDVAGVCPETWTCLDLFVYQPGLSLCKKP